MNLNFKCSYLKTENVKLTGHSLHVSTHNFIKYGINKSLTLRIYFNMQLILNIMYSYMERQWERKREREFKEL